MTLTDSNFYRCSYTQETHKSSYANEPMKLLMTMGLGA